MADISEDIEKLSELLGSRYIHSVNKIKQAIIDEWINENDPIERESLWFRYQAIKDFDLTLNAELSSKRASQI